MCVNFASCYYPMCKYFYSYLVLGVRFCQATKHACVYLTGLILKVYILPYLIILMRVVFQQQKNYV
jgi:hypothetical protein